MFPDRIKKLQAILQHESIDSMLITDSANLSYLSGFVCLSPTEREAYILVTLHSAHIFTSPLYAEEANAQDLELHPLTGKKTLSQSIKEILEKENLTTLGFEEDNLRFAEYDRLTKIDVPLIPMRFDTLRAQKDTEEIAAIENACEIGDKAFQHVLQFIKPGVTEKEIATELELFILRQHAALSFPSIIAFGPEAAVPHHVTSDRKLNNNEFVLLDFGVKYHEYCSDMSRTVFVGTPTDEEKHMYEIVRIAQQNAIDYIEKNTTKSTGKKADDIARTYITEQGFPSFPHSLGHGIGLEVHEFPSLSPYSEGTLLEGMVFSIEPGVYLEKKAGIRIEDLAVLAPEGFRLLTKAPRELITL